jgi:acyl-CoA thioesterase-1
MSRVIGFPLLVWLAAMWLVLPAGSAHAAPPEPPVILVYGDSISAGYGLAPDQGWVKRLADRLRQEGYGFQVVNASVSGETTTGGLARLPRALALHEPRIVILELGGNDGLRGLPLATTRANLDAMLRLARGPGRKVLLLGMRMPPNYGERYTSGFAAAYPELARLQRVALVPFLLEGIAGNPALMQADGIHPNERGQPVLLDNVWQVLRPLLGAKHR